MKSTNVADFIDTNVLIYTDDQDTPDKRDLSLELVADQRRKQSGTVSIQVLQEYFATATRKLGVDPLVARRKTELIAEITLIVPQSEDVLAAIDLSRLYGFSFWDSMIVRSALTSGCKRLFTEDLQHGQRIETLEVVNPFAREQPTWPTE